MSPEATVIALAVLAAGAATTGELCPCGRDVRGPSGDCERCVDERRTPAARRSHRYHARVALAAATLAAATLAG